MDFEILAPAGSMESLIAGVRCGANAVYLGGQSFNARRNAGNFDEEELNKAVDYCHIRGVRVYLTLNTLVSDKEMRDAYSAVKSAMTAGVDAFIVQDLGVATMIKECFPTARLHASTQAAALSPSGFVRLQNMGFSRGVVPREMTFDEIFEVRQSTDMELEAFVHGALCMSVSGQCYLSSVIGCRSGNRGLCAQPCRLPFSADNSGSADLSLKDNSLINHLEELSKAGVYSLKIEGRMKRPEYVAASVTALKSAINGTFTPIEEQKLMSVFSRSGFTDGYFTGKRTSMFGTRRKEDVIAAKDVLKDYSHLYDNETPLVPIDIKAVCKKDKEFVLSADRKNEHFEVVGEVPQVAINKPMTAESLSSRLSKFGGTPFFVNDITVDIDEGLILPASHINGLRREIIEKLSKADKKEFDFNDYKETKGADKKGTPYFTARFSSPESVPDNHPFERLFLPIDTDIDTLLKLDAGVEIPRGLFGIEEKIKSRLKELKKAGVEYTLAGSIASYEMSENLGFETYADFTMNIFNSKSAELFPHFITSFEQTFEDAGKIGGDDKGIVVYGRLPLMLTRNCPVKNAIGCDKCQHSGKLTDRKGYEFKVVCSKYPCVEILNSTVLYMGDRMKEINSDFAHFYFTDESKEKVSHITDLFSKGLPPDFEYTRGLYQRGVL